MVIPIHEISSIPELVREDLVGDDIENELGVIDLDGVKFVIVCGFVDVAVSRSAVEVKVAILLRILKFGV